MTGTTTSAPASETPASASAAPASRGDALAGLLVAVGCVLLGAPVGLLWEAVAPHVVVRVSGSSVSLVSDSGVFLDGDLAFLVTVTLAGLVTGLLGWAAGRRWGPGVVVGLVVGGLAAAWVASKTGELVDEGSAREAVRAGRSGQLELSVRLRATEAVLGWPIGALAGFALPYWVRSPAESEPDEPPAG